MAGYWGHLFARGRIAFTINLRFGIIIANTMTPFLKKHWPLVGIGLLLLVAALYIFGTENKPEEGSRFTDMVLEKGVELMENPSFTQNDPNKGVKWVLDAKEVKSSDNQTTYSGIDFRVKLELQDGIQIDLQGERGNYDRNTGEITLQGNVNGQTDNGYKLVTDHLFYREKKGSLETDAPVKIFGPFFSVSGQGLCFNPEEEVLRIFSDVTTHIGKNRQGS
jgi:LPS export ABC transporter protein LptC